MTRYLRPFAPGAILLLITWVTAAGASGQQPFNVLLITIDNLRPDKMSVYGYAKETTPYLQQFARESLVFERAFSTSAWTAPSMVSMFTGYYPPVHAQHGRFSFYDDKMTSALRLLADQGYEILGQGIRGPSHQGFGFQKLLGTRPDRLESFIEERIENPAPFFAWAHITDVHLPYNPSSQYAERFAANARSNAAIEAVKKHRIILRYPELVNIDLVHAGKIRFEQQDIPLVRALYDAEVAEVDARLQRHLERMRETGLLDRTIVIISADHGEELFEHGWLGHASTGYDAKLYDELIRIPLIIRMPKQARRGRYQAMVQGVDLMPTIFELLGIDADGMIPAMQGHSLLSVINGEGETVRDYVYNQTSLKGWTTPRDEMSLRIVSVRSEDKKLIRIPTATGFRTEAYDLLRDPLELSDIYAQAAEQFRPLEQALQTWSRDNRSIAASLVMGAARHRLDEIAKALLEGGDLNRAVLSWSAIQTMQDTWGLEPDPFFQIEPYASQWLIIQRTAARMIGAAMTCVAEGGELRTDETLQPRLVDYWYCL